MYLAHTAHWQFAGLIAGFLAWILTMTATGLDEWRLWHVADVPVISSGVAWVGIWRACFYSHALSDTENCRSVGVSDAFVPAEITAAQVLMMLAVICGLAANVSAAAAMRMVYFSLEDRGDVGLVFVLAGTLYLLTGTLSFVPLAWNMNSVLHNSTIDFPPEFDLPVAPVRQEVGSAIGVGIFASILMFMSGVVFLSYLYTWRTLRSEGPRRIGDPVRGPWRVATMEQKSELPDGVDKGIDNPVFHIDVS